jgi:hypothetical protein
MQQTVVIGLRRDVRGNPITKPTPAALRDYKPTGDNRSALGFVMIMQPLSKTTKIPVMIDARPSLRPVSAQATNSLSSGILIIEKNSPSSLAAAHLSRGCTLVGESPIPLRQTIPQKLRGSADCFREATILSFIAWAVLENITASPRRGNCFSHPISCSWSSSRLFADERTRQALLVLPFHYSVEGNLFVNWSIASPCTSLAASYDGFRGTQSGVPFTKLKWTSLVDLRYSDVAVQAGHA